jgi:hypothetical protein
MANDWMQNAGIGAGMGAAGIIGHELSNMGPAGYGMAGAGLAGGMIGGAAVWGINEHLKTAIMQEQARQSQAYARAVEAAYMNQRNGTEMGRNTDR